MGIFQDFRFSFQAQGCFVLLLSQDRCSVRVGEKQSAVKIVCFRPSFSQGSYVSTLCSATATCDAEKRSCRSESGIPDVVPSPKSSRNNVGYTSGPQMSV